MNTYERLQEEACEDGIEVVDYTFESDRIKGLYCDGVVAIKKTWTLHRKRVPWQKRWDITIHPLEIL